LKVIAIAADPDGPYVLPSAATVDDGSYPVARELYMYTTGEPTGAVAAYLSWVLGAEAQAIVADLGFIPVVAQAEP